MTREQTQSGRESQSLLVFASFTVSLSSCRCQSSATWMNVWIRGAPKQPGTSASGS